MVQKNKDNVKEKPVLFGNVSKEEYLKRKAEVIKPVYKNGKLKIVKQSRHYKWILSPEKNLDDDVLQEFAKAFVTRMNQISNYELVWQAAIHRDTSHPHIHILVNGVDMNGKEVKGFSKDVIKNYSHEVCQEILTKFCGERDTELKRAARERRFTAERWTEFDQTIKDYMKPANENGFCGFIFNPGNGELKTRLDYLKEIGLAKYEDNKYFIKDNFEERLRIYGKYNTFRDAEKYVSNNSELKFYKAEMGEIQGTVRHVYSMNDEDVWSNGLVLEAEDGQFYYVSSFNPIKHKAGSKIKISQKKHSEGSKYKEQTVIQKIKDDDYEMDRY